VAAELGYNNLFVLHEGMPVWEEKGYAVYAGPDYEKRIETTKITPQELKILIETKSGTFTLVDVRDPQEFAEGHIPGAINIPSGKFAAGSAVLDKEKLVVVYCKSGGRSYTAYRKLQKLDYSKIVQAILADWEEAGLPVTK
jgi:rhodanese-related sulfurtransferase